jgi:small conductance mechanosensitive channel
METMIVNLFELMINWFHENGYRIWQLGTYLLTIYLIYLGFSYSLKRLSKQPYFGIHLENVTRLFLRVLAIIIGLSAIFSVFEIPASYFIGSSAFIGAVIGFGSSQTINNVAAGFFVIFSRPFLVMDYVKIGEYEGQVEEITINYTKLYTPSFNMLQIPNVQVLNSRILNATHEGMIKNTFLFSTPHSIPLSNEDILKNCIEPSINDIVARYEDCILRRPEVFFDNSGNFARTYKIRLFVPKGKAKDLYVIQSELSNNIMNRWDQERKKIK